eukprot:scaffold958_cov325-Prasinococcus_capsulatus_cf.AAC.4
MDVRDFRAKLVAQQRAEEGGSDEMPGDSEGESGTRPGHSPRRARSPQPVARGGPITRPDAFSLRGARCCWGARGRSSASRCGSSTSTSACCCCSSTTPSSPRASSSTAPPPSSTHAARRVGSNMTDAGTRTTAAAAADGARSRRQRARVRAAGWRGGACGSAATSARAASSAARACDSSWARRAARWRRPWRCARVTRRRPPCARPTLGSWRDSPGRGAAGVLLASAG